MSTEAEVFDVLSAVQGRSIDLTSATRTAEIDEIRARLDDLIVEARHARRVLDEFEGWA